MHDFAHVIKELPIDHFDFNVSHVGHLILARVVRSGGNAAEVPLSRILLDWLLHDLPDDVGPTHILLIDKPFFNKSTLDRDLFVHLYCFELKV